MSKELPYFKFIANEWLTGNIAFEELETQGLFINICALYWQRDGNLTLRDIEKRYKNREALQVLISDYLKIEGDTIRINFLDEQFQEREALSKTNSQNGAKGGRPKNPTESEKKRSVNFANPTQSEPKAKKSNIEKERDKEEDKNIHSNTSNTLTGYLPDSDSINRQHIENAQRIYKSNKDIFLSDEQVKNQWQIFISTSMEASYPTETRAFQHFYNWLKKQDIKYKPKVYL